MSVVRQDPWLVEQVDAVIAYHTTPDRLPPALMNLSEEGRVEAIEKLRSALFADPKLNNSCKAKRLRAYRKLLTEALAYKQYASRLPAAGQTAATNILEGKPAAYTHEELIENTALLRRIYLRLKELAKKAPAKVKRQAAAAKTGTKKKLTLIQRLLLKEAQFGAEEYARSIGRRIRRYEAACAKDTPASVVCARFLWTEMGDSLRGWKAAHNADTIRALRDKADGDEDLLAFVNKGYDIANPERCAPAWYGTPPEFFRAWNPKWGTPPKGANRIVRWLYDAVQSANDPDRFLTLEDVLAVFADADAEEVLYVLFGYDTGERPRGGKPTWALRGAKLNVLVPAPNYFSGDLFQRRRNNKAEAQTYKAAQDTAQAEFLSAIEEATEAPEPSAYGIDPLVGPKITIATRQGATIGALTAGQGAEWSTVADGLTPRDPWIPLDVLSAFVSIQCQFPWPKWAVLWRYPMPSASSGAFGGEVASRASSLLPGSAVPGGQKPWFFPTFMSGRTVMRPEWQYTAYLPEDLEFPAGSYDKSEISDRYGGQASSYSLRVQSTRAANKQDGGAKWSRQGNLSEIRGFVPWRLEVVRLTAQSAGRSGVFTYRTYDWFPYTLSGSTTYQQLVDEFKLPTETAQEFRDSLIAHNGPPESEGREQNPIIQLIGGDDPLSLTGLHWGTESYQGYDPTTYANVTRTRRTLLQGDVKTIRVPRLIPADLLTRTGGGVNKIGRKNDVPVRLEAGISPMAMMFLAYLNNNYTAIPSTIGSTLYNRKRLYRLISGASSREAGETVIERLYQTPWPDAVGYFGKGEVPPNEGDRLLAETDDYDGPYNPSLIPKISDPAGLLFGRGYRFSLGLLARLCANKEKIDKNDKNPDAERSRLTDYERSVGVPEPQGQTVRIAKEVKRRAKLSRIEALEKVLTEEFQRYLAIPKEGPDNAVKKSYREAILRRYNAVWSGYFPATEAQPDLYDTAYQTELQFGVPTTKITSFISRWTSGYTPTPKEHAADLAKVRRGDAPTYRINKGEWNTYPYQSDAVLRLDEQGGGLLAFDVGVGKTMTALAAVGWAKQRGRTKRPVFLVPKAIKFKWWKDIRVSYADWYIGVLGHTYRMPSGPDDFNSKQSRRYDLWHGHFLAAFVKAGYVDPNAKANEAAKALVLLGGTAASVLSKYPDALKVLGKKAKGTVYKAARPTWCKDTDPETKLKLQRFAAGFYDCLLTDEFDFKNIALDREGAIDHLLRGSASRYNLWRRAFSSRGKDAFGARFRDAGATQSAIQTTLKGPAKGDTDRRSAAVSAREDGLPEPYDTYAAPMLQDFAGAAKAPWWEQLGEAFYGKNMLLPRTTEDVECAAVFHRLLLGGGKGAFSPSGYTIVYDTADYSPVSIDPAYGDAIEAMTKAGTPLPIGELPVAGLNPWFKHETRFIYDIVGAVPESPADYTPDGMLAQGSAGQYGEFDYASGFAVLRPINHAQTGFAGAPPTAVSAHDAALEAAAYINANLAAFGLTVKVKAAATQAFHSATAKTKEHWTQTRPPNLDTTEGRAFTSLDQAKKAISRRVKIPALYYGQDSHRTPPPITWETLGVDCLIVDEAHKFKGLFNARGRGGTVAYLASGESSTRAWVLEYMASIVKQQRNGRVVLLTATPAKQSPLDFYNIIQFLGAPGLGPDDNLFNSFYLDTAEQFVSRFVKIADNVVINTKGEASRSPAADAFQNLSDEFFPAFRRYANRKTVNDVPYLRGETVAQGHPQEGGLGAAVFDVDAETISIKGFRGAEDLDDVADLSNYRFRVVTGEGEGSYNITGGAYDVPSDMGYVNVQPPLPAASTYSRRAGGDAWVIYKDARVPLAPTPTKALVKMSPPQDALYKKIQHALARMYIDDVATWKIDVGGIDMTIDRRSVFGRMSRIAQHPDLEMLETKASGADEEENEDEEAETTTTKVMFPDRYTYGLLTALDPDFDAYDAKGAKTLQALIGIRGSDDSDEDEEEEAAKKPNRGLMGSVPLDNPEHTALRDMWGTLRRSRAAALDAAPTAGLTEKEMTDTLVETRETWEKEPSVLGARPKNAKAQKAGDPEIHPTNGADYARFKALFDASEPLAQRAPLLKDLWDTTRGAWFQVGGSKSALKPLISTKAAKVLAAKKRGMNPLPDVDPISSRTTALADRIVGQNIEDSSAPYRGAVTCGHLIFVDNLFYQAWQMVSYCRVYGLARACASELLAYRTEQRAAKAPLDANEIKKILAFYKLGTWGCYWTVRAVMLKVFPQAQAAVADTDQGDRPARPRRTDETPAKDPSLHAIQNALLWVWDAQQEDAYSLVREAVPGAVDFYDVIRSHGAKPPRRTTLNIAVVKRAYLDGWEAAASKVVVMNAQMSPSTVREVLAQEFNGEFEGVETEEDVVQEDGTIRKVKRVRYSPLRQPKYDVVIANSVAYEGVDLQVRTCRIIHADLPWTSADFTQRNGRAVRQGNLYKKVQILVYLSEGTVDYYRLQGIERKKGWMESALASKDSTFKLSDNEAELLELALNSVAEGDRDAVRVRVERKLQAIKAERINLFYEGVLKTLEHAYSRSRKLRLAEAADAAGAYEKTANAADKAMREALNQADGVGGEGVGGENIYGRDFRPSYFEVCSETLYAGRQALPNPNPYDGEPYTSSPAPPIVENSLLGVYMPEHKAQDAYFDGAENYRVVPFRENDAARDFKVRDPVKGTFMPMVFIPLVWVGRFGNMSAAGAGSVGRRIGVLPLFLNENFRATPTARATRDAYRPNLNQSVEVNLTDWEVWTAAQFVDLAGNVRLPYALRSVWDVRSGAYRTHNASAVIPATWDEVKQYVASTNIPLMHNGVVGTKELAERIGVEVGWSHLGYIGTDWLTEHEQAVQGALDYAAAHRYGQAEKGVYIPYSVGGKLVIVPGKLLKGAQVRERFARNPADARERLARGQTIPAIEDAEEALEQAEGALKAAKAAVKEASKYVTATRNEEKESRARRDKAKLKRETAQEAADDVLTALRVMGDEASEGLKKKAAAEQEKIDKVQAAVDEAEAEFAAASTDYKEARGDHDSATGAVETAEGAVSTAKDSALMAQAVETRPILPTREGFEEFVTKLRAADFAPQISVGLPVGKVALNAAKLTFMTWFVGDARPAVIEGQNEWWGVPAHPSHYFTSYESSEHEKRTRSAAEMRQQALRFTDKKRAAPSVEVGGQRFVLTKMGMLKGGDVFFTPGEEPLFVYRVEGTPSLVRDADGSLAGVSVAVETLGTLDEDDGSFVPRGDGAVDVSTDTHDQNSEAAVVPKALVEDVSEE